MQESLEEEVLNKNVLIADSSCTSKQRRTRDDGTLTYEMVTYCRQDPVASPT